MASSRQPGQCSETLAQKGKEGWMSLVAECLYLSCMSDGPVLSTTQRKKDTELGQGSNSGDEGQVS